MNKLNGTSANERIEQEYLANPRCSDIEVHAIVAAFSLHGREGHTHLRDQIVRGYEIANRHHPVVSELIAKDLAGWRLSRTR
jgi:hypothetical protein